MKGIIVRTVKWIFDNVSKKFLKKEKRHAVSFKVEKRKEVVETATVTVEIPGSINVESLSEIDWDRLIENGQRAKIIFDSSDSGVSQQ